MDFIKFNGDYAEKQTTVKGVINVLVKYFK